MPAATLLLSTTLDVASFVLYVLAARVVLRQLPANRELSSEAFALFWYAVGLVNLLQAGLEFAALFGDPGLTLAWAVWNTRIALALVGFAGLMYYLGYLYTGRRGIRGPIILFYGATFLLMQAWLIGAQPNAAEVSAWRVDLAFGAPARTPLYDAVVILFFVPPLLGAVLYGFTLRFVDDPAGRRRVVIMSTSFAVYFAGLTAGYLVSWFWWGLVENVLGIGAALGVLAAFHPALAVRARPARAPLHPALEARVRDLI